MHITKIVGSRNLRRTPSENLAHAERMIAEAHKLAPVPKPRGFVLKARTHEEMREKMRSFNNPRWQ